MRDSNLQTLETTRGCARSIRELIGSVLKSLYDRRAAGDIEGMLNLLAPDVVCFPDRTWGHAHYPRRIVGKEAVREAFLQRHINYVFVEMEVHRTLIDGEQAAVHRTTKLRERGSGVTYTFNSVSFFRFRDGLIIELSELPDGSALEAVINFPH